MPVGFVCEWMMGADINYWDFEPIKRIRNYFLECNDLSLRVPTKSEQLLITGLCWVSLCST